MSLEELIQAANQLNETDLDQLLHQIASLRARRKPNVLSAEEAQLLLKINQGVPTDLRARYQELRQKREAETLTTSEHETLIQLSNQIEEIGAQRLAALAQLAQLRQVSLLDLMETLVFNLSPMPEEAIAGIQQGLDDFEAGRYRSFQDFAEEQRRKYNLPADS